MRNWSLGTNGEETCPGLQGKVRSMQDSCQEALRTIPELKFIDEGNSIYVRDNLKSHLTSCLSQNPHQERSRQACQSGNFFPTGFLCQNFFLFFHFRKCNIKEIWGKVFYFSLREKKYLFWCISPSLNNLALQNCCLKIFPPKNRLSYFISRDSFKFVSYQTWNIWLFFVSMETGL